MSNTNSGNSSPYELRHAIVTHLMALNTQQRREIESDLTRINTITSTIDKIVSGKGDKIVPAVPSLVDEFQSFVGKQKIIDNLHGSITPVWKTWYNREFERLTAPTEGPAILQEVCFSRQDGVTTFLSLYVAFMAWSGHTMVVLVRTIDDRDRFFKSVQDMIPLNIDVVQVLHTPDNMRGDHYHQVIGDNSEIHMVSRHRLTETPKILIPARAGNSGQCVMYHTV